MRSCILLLLIFIGGQVHGQKFKKEQSPSWVTPIVSKVKSKVSKYDVNSGAYYSLIDHQINLAEDAEYTHLVNNILTNAGISTSSEIHIPYDTSYQHVDFHHLYIWRKGKKIDKTDEVSFEFIHVEQNLQSSIYTGMVTAYAVLNDIRKEDKIEYAYTLFGSNPIYFGNKDQMITVNQINPVDHIHMKFLYPKDEEYNYILNDEEGITIKEGQQDNYKTIMVSAENVSAINIEDSMPPWYFPLNFFSISNMQTWNDAARWADQVFSLDQSPDLQPVFQETFSGGESTEDKINALIDYVQNDIRYMGIESGMGSILPFPPEQVIEQRFGDCKDKSLLLVHLLKSIGVDTAHVALVNSAVKGIVDKMRPGAIAFNHVIVHFTHKGKSYWIDPTIALQGGDYKQRQSPLYSKALIVDTMTTDLIEMTQDPSLSTMTVKEEIHLTSFDKPGTYLIQTTYTGANADYARMALEYMSLKEFSDYLKSSYTGLYANISTKEKLTIDDNESTNTLVLHESYTIDDVWQKEAVAEKFNKSTMRYEPLVLYNYIYPMNCDTKEHPVYISYPTNFVQKTKILLPQEMTLDTPDGSTDNEAYTFRQKARMQGKKILHLEYTFSSKKETIAASKYGPVCADINEDLRNLPLEIFYLNENK